MVVMVEGGADFGRGPQDWIVQSPQTERRSAGVDQENDWEFQSIKWLTRRDSLRASRSAMAPTRRPAT